VAQRVGVGGELAGFHQLEDHLLLALRVGVDADLGVGHLEVVERGAPLMRGLPAITSW
jgi:hypothetical protein